MRSSLGHTLTRTCTPFRHRLPSELRRSAAIPVKTLDCPAPPVSAALLVHLPRPCPCPVCCCSTEPPSHVTISWATEIHYCEHRDSDHFLAAWAFLSSCLAAPAGRNSVHVCAREEHGWWGEMLGILVWNWAMEHSPLCSRPAGCGRSLLCPVPKGPELSLRTVVMAVVSPSQGAWQGRLLRRSGGSCSPGGLARQLRLQVRVGAQGG